MYSGYMAKDRWGRYLFHKGPYHLLLSDEAAKKLKKFTGKPIEINVKEMYQLINPGGATIKTIKRVLIKGVLKNLKLSISSTETRVAQGKGVKLRLSLENKSKKTATFLPGTLALCIVTRDPRRNDVIGYRGRGGRAYWYYTDTFFRHDSFKNPERIACHRIILPITGKEIVDKGKRLQLTPEKKVYKNLYGVEPEAVSFHDSPVIIKPKGVFSTEYLIGTELPTGEYEIFLYVTNGNFSYPAAPMSKRLPFDVFEAKTGKNKQK